MDVRLFLQTVLPAGAVSHAVGGSFLEPDVHEIAVVHSTWLEILRPDATGRLQRVARRDCRGRVRSVESIRLSGDDRDALVIAADSGAVVVLRCVCGAFYIPSRGD